MALFVADDMESGNWTQEKLEKVVKEREEKAGLRISSDIVRSDYFCKNNQDVSIIYFFLINYFII